MRRMRRAIGVGVCVAVLAAACADGGADERATEDEAEVLGIQVERDGDVVETFEPTENPTSPTPSPAATSPDATEAATGSVVADDTAPDDTAEPEPDPEPRPAAPPPSAPSPAASPSPSPTPSPNPEPVRLTTREGHSYVTWFRHEEPDGQGGTRYVWSEVSAAPVVTRDGSEPLRVTLVDLAGDPDRSAPRRAQCPAYLEVDGDRAVTARGSLRVEVVVDDATVSSGVRDIDVTVQPGERRDLVAIGDVRVAVPDVAEVTCRVTFTEDGTR